MARGRGALWRSPSHEEGSYGLAAATDSAITHVRMWKKVSKSAQRPSSLAAVSVATPASGT